VAGSPFPAGTGPLAIAVDLKGQYAFVANGGSNNVSVYSIDQATGVLSAVAGSPFATAGPHPQSVAVDPLGNFLYVVDFSTSDVSIFAINGLNGALSLLGSVSPGGAWSIAVDPSGKYAYVATGFGLQGYAIDSVTGALTALGPISTPMNSNSIDVVVDRAGNLVYSLDNATDSVNVYTLNVATGDLSLVAGSPFALVSGAQGQGPTSMAIWH